VAQHSVEPEYPLQHWLFPGKLTPKPSRHPSGQEITYEAMDRPKKLFDLGLVLLKKASDLGRVFT
jgi:hypothetical protein